MGQASRARTVPGTWSWCLGGLCPPPRSGRSFAGTRSGRAVSAAGPVSTGRPPGTRTSSEPSLSDKKAEIDILAAEYIAMVKTLSPDQRVEHLQKIQSAYSKCKEYSDDKVQLAMQTYEMVSPAARPLPPLPPSAPSPPRSGQPVSASGGSVRGRGAPRAAAALRSSVPLLLVDWVAEAVHLRPC